MVIQKSAGAHLQCLRLWTGLTVIAWFALGRGGIFSCQVDSNNSKPAATDTRMFPWWDWFDEMAMPLFIWLRGLKSPERITEVHISYLQWLSHEKEMHLLMYTHTNRAITSTHIYPDPCMQMYENITCSPVCRTGCFAFYLGELCIS